MLLTGRSQCHMPQNIRTSRGRHKDYRRDYKEAKKAQASYGLVGKPAFKFLGNAIRYSRPPRFMFSVDRLAAKQ